MKLTGILFILLTIVSAGLCGEPGSVESFSLNLEKYRLMERSYQHVDSLANEQKVDEKSVFGAAVYSAVIPGAGFMPDRSGKQFFLPESRSHRGRHI